MSTGVDDELFRASPIDRSSPVPLYFQLAQQLEAAINDGRFTLSSQSELGHSLRRSGAIDEADAEYRQTIVGWQLSGNRGAVANQLESMAFTSIARDRGARAAQLLGAAEALRDMSGDPMTADEHDEYDAEIERLRGLLDPEALRAAWAEGRAMSSAAAVALALSE